MDNNKAIKNFTDLKVWQKAHRLFLNLTDDIKNFRNFSVKYIIIDQIFRSSSAISSNIAEGFNAQSTKEYIRYLDIARRTTAGTENWVYKIKDLKLLDSEICEERIQDCKEVSRMLHGLMVSLRGKAY